MGVLRKLKAAYRRIKTRVHHDRKPFSPPQSPIRDAAAFYQHTNGQIQPEPTEGIPPARTHRRNQMADIREPLELTHKSYTTASGVVIPADFSYDRPKKIYRVSGIMPRSYWDVNMDLDEEEDNEMLDEDMIMVNKIESESFDGDDEASIFGDSEVLTASDSSFNTLCRTTELSLAGHHHTQDRRSVQIESSRSLPEVSENVVGDDIHMPAPRGIHILSAQHTRRVRGLRINNGGNGPSRIVRIIGGGEASSGDEQPRPVWR
ncbi:hypothetical protein PMIN06_009063 [Paraphaeosphaeria minitans]|uniref:Uncharacterized protein n=1 Tax=Paraphaeosphaeria minitans TaxID=565426 RepID=A0A9P6G9W1_9PLEO|nr:hypothetical protein PMIN01_11223 [Paraphaeosphaeria minitans]